MNAYTTRSQFRIQPRDLEAIVGAPGFVAASHLLALERQRGRRAEAEVARLLKEHGVAPISAASRVTMVRQTIGATLIRLGERLMCTSPRMASPGTTGVSGRLGATM